MVAGHAAAVIVLTDYCTGRLVRTDDVCAPPKWEIQPLDYYKETAWDESREK